MLRLVDESKNLYVDDASGRWVVFLRFAFGTLAVVYLRSEAAAQSFLASQPPVQLIQSGVFWDEALTPPT
jgi:hypothetical protein